MRHASSRRSAVLVAGLLAAVLTGCGEREPATPAPASPLPGVGEVTVAADGVQEITLQTQDDYEFLPDRFTVAPGQVRLTVLNVAEDLTHNFRFTPGAGPEPIGEEIRLLPPAGRGGEPPSETIEFAVEEPGEHRFECSFHTRLDQVGTMTVEG